MSPQINTEYHAEDSIPHQNVGCPWVAGAFLIDNFLLLLDFARPNRQIVLGLAILEERMREAPGRSARGKSFAAATLELCSCGNYVSFVLTCLLILIFPGSRIMRFPP